MLNYNEGWQRGLATFFQTLGGTLTSLLAADVMSAQMDMSILLKVGVAVQGAVVAGVAAFCRNVTKDSGYIDIDPDDEEDEV